MLVVTSFLWIHTFRLLQGSQEKALFLGWRLVAEAGIMLVTP
jgi:hypothetical protein